MFKKVIIVIVVAALLLTSIPALAATPSKTVNDLTKVVSIKTMDGKALPQLIYIRKEPTVFAKTLLNELTSFKKQKSTIIDYFAKEVIEAIPELVPTVTDPKVLDLTEFVSLGIGDYLAEYGDIVCTFQLPTEFQETQPVVALFSFPDEKGDAVWVPLETKVDDGKVVIVFPSEVLLKAGKDAIISVLAK